MEETAALPLDALVHERDEISKLIRQTPHADKAIVSTYHEDIIKRLDSEAIIPIPSPEHRSLHQLMWVKGYEVYTGQQDSQEARLEFTRTEQRQRFDWWYAMRYVFEKKLTSWEQDLIRDATKTCMEVYKHPFEMLRGEDLGV